MARITADSELMTNYIAAVPVPASSKFMTVLDQNRRPMVLSLSNDTVPKLQVILTGHDGAPTLINLASKLGIPSASIVQTFSVEQANDLTLYLAVAYRAAQDTSTLVVAHPCTPLNLQTAVDLPVIPGAATIGTAESIYITPTNTLEQGDHPTIFVVHKNRDQKISFGDTITEVTVRANAVDWTISQRMDTPENVDEILSIAPAANIYGKGLFVLYKTNNKTTTKLYARFIRPDPSTGTIISFVTSVACPQNASCIASYWGPQRRSCLLIAAPDGIRMLSPSESVSRTAVGTLIATDPIARNISQLVVAQDNDSLSLWFRSQAEELCYLRATTDNLKQGVLSRLLPAGQASSFAACVARPDDVTGHIAWQMLVSNDANGNLTLLQQALDTGIWKMALFYAPSDTENIAVQSYTVTLHGRDGNNHPVKNGRIFVAGSSSVSVICNGRNQILTTSGDWYATDSGGAVNFIIASNTLACQTLQISSLQSSELKDLDVQAFSFNPASKAMSTLDKKMSSIDTAEKLAAAPIFAGSKPDHEILKASVEAFKNLRTAYNDLPPNGSTSGSNVVPHAQTRLASRNAASSTIAIGASRGAVDTIEDVLWDGWHWLTQKVHDAYEWVVSKINDAWHFICKIAGEVKSFVLDCLEKVGEALTWVFDKIKAAWDKLVEWIGFIFSWNDILETRDTINSVINAGLDFGAQKVEDVAARADAMFVGLLGDVDKFMVAPKGFAKISGDSASSNDHDGAVTTCTSSTKFNWAGERLKNGGAGTSSRVQTSEGGSSEALTTWQSVFQPALENVKAAVDKVTKDLCDLWNQQGSMSSGDLMNLGKDVVKLAIETIRGLVSSLLRLVAKILQKVNEYGNAPIQIPIFSSLYKLIAKKDLTVFDAISLILAFPTTIFMKIITGKKPPQLPGINGKVLGQIILGPDKDGQAASDQMILDFNTLTAGITVSGIMVSTITNTIKLIYKSVSGGVAEASAVFKGPGGFLEIFGIVVDMIGTLHAMPTDPDLPGLQYRKWVAYISLIRGSAHLVHLFAGGGEAAEKALLVFDVLSALTNFGLQQATYAAEIDEGSKWKDWDNDDNTMGTVSSGLNAIAAIGYFGAFLTGAEQPEVAAVGLVILEAGTVGLAVMEGVRFKKAYDKRAKTRLLPPSV